MSPVSARLAVGHIGSCIWFRDLPGYSQWGLNTAASRQTSHLTTLACPTEELTKSQQLFLTVCLDASLCFLGTLISPVHF